jgi:hypothetical protein
VRVIVEVSLEVEAAQSEFVERCETLRRLLILQVGEVNDLKDEEQLIADHLMDQRTQQKHDHHHQSYHKNHLSDSFKGIVALENEESIFLHSKGNTYLGHDRFFLS